MNADKQPERALRRETGTRRCIGITGHLDLSSTTRRLVAVELRRHLLTALGEDAEHGRADDGYHREAAGLTGVSCLARGADSVFAEVLIELGGRLEVILPSADYRRVQVAPEHAPLFDALIKSAASVRVMPCDTAGPQAYVAANNAMLDKVDSLFAVWDGENGAEGGTGHVVEQARTRRIPVTVIWPTGSERT